MRNRLLAILVFAIVAAPAFGTTLIPGLGAAGSFGILGSTVSNTGTSLVTGDVGATTALTGFPPGTATGVVYPAPSDPAVTAAYTDFLTAYGIAFSDVSTPPTVSVPNLTTDRTFAGNNVFTFPLLDVVSTAGITLTFDADNDSSEYFIIKTSRDLTVNGPLTFSLVNGALATNIFWIVGRSVDMSSSSTAIDWEGSILAGTSFSMAANPGGVGVLAGTIGGCVFAGSALTLAGPTNVAGCVAAVPEPGTFGPVGVAALVTLLAFHRRRRREVSRAA